MSKMMQRLLLVVFVVVDIVLIVGALRHVNGTPPAADLPDAAATSTPSPSSGAPGTTAAPTQLPYDFTASQAVALSAANDGTVVFGTRGRCSDPEATVQVSTDGGADFAPAQTALTTILAVRTTGKSAMAVVGTTVDCEVRQITSTNGGASWTPADDVTLWYPDPDDTASVVTPGGTSQPGEGCVVTSVSQVTAEGGRVSCADGAIRGSGDDGKTWVQLGRLDNVRVSAFLTPSAGFALARFSGCAANAFTTKDGGVTWAPGGCISGDPAQAIAATSSRLVAVVADGFYASDDKGSDWMQP